MLPNGKLPFGKKSLLLNGKILKNIIIFAEGYKNTTDAKSI